jgi:hypothetical protein
MTQRSTQAKLQRPHIVRRTSSSGVWLFRTTTSVLRFLYRACQVAAVIAGTLAAVAAALYIVRPDLRPLSAPQDSSGELSSIEIRQFNVLFRDRPKATYQTAGQTGASTELDTVNGIVLSFRFDFKGYAGIPGWFAVAYQRPVLPVYWTMYKLDQSAMASMAINRPIDPGLVGTKYAGDLAYVDQFAALISADLNEVAAIKQFWVPAPHLPGIFRLDLSAYNQAGEGRVELDHASSPVFQCQFQTRRSEYECGAPTPPSPTPVRSLPTPTLSPIGTPTVIAPATSTPTEIDTSSSAQ